jgi:hypothetical protein
MNCYTKEEKIQMAIEEITAKVKMVVEITVIVAGVVALGIIGIMNSKIATLEKELETYKYVQEQETKSTESYILVDGHKYMVVDTVY